MLFRSFPPERSRWSDLRKAFLYSPPLLLSGIGDTLIGRLYHFLGRQARKFCPFSECAKNAQGTGAIRKKAVARGGGGSFFVLLPVSIDDIAGLTDTPTPLKSKKRLGSQTQSGPMGTPGPTEIVCRAPCPHGAAFFITSFRRFGPLRHPGQGRYSLAC